MNKTKQNMQFKLKYAMFFRWDTKGRLIQLPTNALHEEILAADRVTLKLDNQKNGWKVVCVYQEQNGYARSRPVQALVRQCVSIRQNMSTRKI